MTRPPIRLGNIGENVIPSFGHWMDAVSGNLEENDNSKSYLVGLANPMRRVEDLVNIITGPLDADMLAAQQIRTEKISSTKSAYIYKLQSTNGYCWWTSILMIQLLKSKLSAEKFDISAFYQFVWTLIKNKHEKQDYQDHMYLDRNGDVDDKLVTAWDEKHKIYKSSFIMSEDVCGYHVEAKTVHDSEHAWVEVKFVRNAPREYVVSTKDVLSTKIQTLSKYLSNTYDLVYVLILYAMMSNKSFMSVPGDLESNEWTRCYSMS